MECFNTSDFLDSSDIVSIRLLDGKKLNIDVNGLSGSPVCSWMRGNRTIMTSDTSHLMITPPLSKTDSDQYTLTCSDHNTTIFSKTVVLRVLQRRPTKPQLLLTDVENPSRSAYFMCISEDIPKPTIEWSTNEKGMDISDEKAKSKVSTTRYEDKGVTCCATNTEGQECTQLYDYAEGFVSAQLDERLNVLAEKKAGCLEAKLSYRPALQLCYWEDPDGKVTKCTETWVTKHRTVKFCELKTSGIYKLFLEAAGKKETKEITVCLADKPEFKFEKGYNSLTYEVESVAPVNFTWTSCKSSNDSCKTNSSWEVVADGYEEHPDELCVKNVKSSLNEDKVAGSLVKFCVKNSLGFWCEQTYVMQTAASPQASTGFLHSDYGSTMPLKVCIFILLLAFAFVVIALFYFVQKKVCFTHCCIFCQLHGEALN
ncbi:hypothetical protein FQA47_022599 [Oryzias melastigma]|uniref:Ig-like domain-containing protein n=1 Tax=Oryzias melastigma TaxID=30732 RepID=A0A834CGX4_ORYME|nr:hypothetical protein FQA47_022599 [Oryzias melastigma]